MRTAGAPWVHVRAPGKINLALRVGAREPSGYHPLATVFQAVSLFEDVIATPADGIALSVEGRGAAGLPTGSANLAVRAAELLREVTATSSGVALHVVKQVPVAGGMAGGSADAAAALIACDQLWGTGLARAELVELAAELGADVPFALTGLTAVGTGHGDRISSAMARGTYHWVLAIQEEHLATPRVFAAFDEIATGVTREPPELDGGLMAALLAGDAHELARHLVNDLTEAAVELMPVLGDVLAAAERAGALGSVVSGSGPTVAALAVDAAHADSVAEVLRRAEVAAEVLVVSGPAPGARVLEHVQGRS